MPFTELARDITHDIQAAEQCLLLDMSIVEIPFIELAHDVGQDIEAPQKFRPRAFKTHLWHRDCPKGGRYIYVARDPIDIALSFFRFFEGWFFEPGEVAVDEFVKRCAKPTSSAHHLCMCMCMCMCMCKCMCMCIYLYAYMQ
jgi:hypothetical protein